jgi:rubrerythrin
MSAIVDIVETRIPDITSDCPDYWSNLNQACNAAPPPFGESWYGDLFRRHATDLQWLVQIIALNARKEADGARQLWQFSRRIADPSIRSQVKDHAIDEARHSSFYIAMLGLMFPGEIADADLRSLRAIVPKFDRDDDALESERMASTEDVLDEIVQMNIGEIRTLINQMLMRPMVDILTPESNRERALKLIDGLGDDEARHIDYTARIIDALGEPALTSHFMRLRLEEFNHITMAELGSDEEARAAYS